MLFVRGMANAMCLTVGQVSHYKGAKKLMGVLPAAKYISKRLKFSYSFIYELSP